jgi:hypothetical protein
MIDPERIASAQPPEHWPRTEAQFQQTLLDVFGQHLMDRRDNVMRRATRVILDGEPYARGRVHQRPLAALADLNLDEEARGKLLDVIAVFVDEGIEHCLQLFNAMTNTVGDAHVARYYVATWIERRGFSALDAWKTKAFEAETAETGQGDSRENEEQRDEEASGVPHLPAIPGVLLDEPLWFEYRKRLNRYATTRRSARPTH